MSVLESLIKAVTACPQRKLIFASESEGLKQRKNMIKKHGDSARCLKVYFCHSCQGYHLGHRRGTNRWWRR